MKDGIRLAAGLLFWLMIAGLGWRHLNADQEASRTADRLVKHFTGRPEVFNAQFPLSAPLAPGNPVRVRVKDGFFAAGRVEEVSRTNSHQQARIAIFPEYAPMMGAGTRLVAARTASDVGWVVRTLLPDDTQGEIRRILLGRWERERDTLMRELRPGLTRLLEDTLTLIQQELPAITRTHKDDFDTIGDVLREKGWEAHVEEVFSAVLWPLVQNRSEPLLNEIGDEIVGEFPVWSMSWAYLAESIPFTEKGRFEKKVRDFIKKEAVPIIKKRQGDLRSVAYRALEDTLREERTIQELQQAVEDVTRDERFRRATQSILKALFIENQRFKTLTTGIWRRPDLRTPVDNFITSFEPTVQTVANRLLMNDRQDGINPDLARVLRRKLLREDEDWVLLDLIGGNKGEIPAVLPGIDGGRR